VSPGAGPSGPGVSHATTVSSPDAPSGSYAATVPLAAVIRALALVVLFAGCRERPAEPPPPPVKPSGQAAELQALGYLEHSPEPADRTKMGVTVHDATRVQPGYTLITLFGSCNTQLLTLDGDMKHAWSHERCVSWSHATLLDNGDILVPGVGKTVHLKQPPFDERRYLLRMAWDGRVIWQRPLTAHHQAIATADGSVLALTLRDRRIAAFSERHNVQDNLITSLSAEGAVSGNLSLYQTLTASGVTLQPAKPSNEHGRRRIDLFHANSLDLMRNRSLARRHPLYQVGNILVSMRHQNALVIIDPRTRRAVWSWGHGTLSGPHDATVLEGGNILTLDNGLARAWSRVIEVDPVTNEIVWQWGKAKPRDFFTAGRGSAQRLDNGNTLITESDQGRVFEITRDGDIVWEYWVPILNRKGHRATVVRARRYPAPFIDALRKR